MQILIYGAGNLILSDEGFGVHFVRHMERVYQVPDNVELYDGGTLGIMVHFKFEESDKVILVDVVKAKGEPGDVFRYEREDIMLKKIPVKMSPHQIGLQEMLLISEMRDAPKPDLTLFGIVAGSLEPGDQLTAPLQAGLEKVAALVIEELRSVGVEIKRKENPVSAADSHPSINCADGRGRFI